MILNIQIYAAMKQDQLQDLDLLLSYVSSGDENAFEDLHKFYNTQLNSYILSFTGSHCLTEEIVQDVFLKIWMNRANLNELKCFKSYLFVIARNHTLDCLKQIKRRKKRQKEWENTISSTNVSIHSSESAMKNSFDRIDKALKYLPCQQKKVYLLRNEGLKHIDIARKLHISVETVKKHLVLARRFLIKRLTENIHEF